MTLDAEAVQNIKDNPQDAASLANLIYLSEDDLSIKRKRRGRGFSYQLNGEIISDTNHLDRIKSLVIPPAWEDVKIAPIENGHLQVVGRDDKNRKQYLYHPSWNNLRNQTKFYKMIKFGEILPKIRKSVEKDLDLPNMSQRKVLALVIRLMEETHIRIGNAYYAKNNKTYGLSTLRTRHLKTSKTNVKFEFVGKKGKEHSITIKNKKLVKLVNQCEEIPGWELFKFIDENGEKHSIDSGMINDYIHEISGERFSAKDFRTWAASKIFFETLYKEGYIEDEKENKKNIITAFDAAANGLGNTRDVCRHYNVHPNIVENYENGAIDSFFKKVKNNNSKNYATLSGTEKVMLEMISEYEIEV
jgi:DNA topoisomerase-1